MSHPEVELIGVVDTDLAAAQRFATMFGVSYSGNNVATALTKLQPDIVTVAVPYQFQRSIVSEITGGTHLPRRLLLEKPLAENLEDAEWIVAECARHGIDLLVNNECAAPVYEQVRCLLEERFDNQVIGVNASCSSGLHAVGIHLIGALHYLFGNVDWVRATLEQEHVESLPFSKNFVPTDLRAHAFLSFGNGVSGFLLNSALLQYTYKEIEILCQGGKLRLSDNDRLLQVWTTAVPGKSTISYRLAPPETSPVADGTTFGVIGAMLASDCQEAGRDVIGGARALQVYRVLDALIESGRTSREVSVRH